HRLAETAHDQHDAGGPRHIPLAADLFDIFDVHFLRNPFLEQDRRILRNRLKCRIVVKRKGRHSDAYTDLEAALDPQLWIDATCQIRKETTNRRDHSLLLDADRGIAEARSEFERVNAVAVDDAIEINVADIPFLCESRFKLLERGVEQPVGTAPEH